MVRRSASVGSVRSMYRLLEAADAVRERRAQRTHPPCAVPRLVARAPNHVWTWDVTELNGPVKGERYPLYVVLDLFRRDVVAWMLARRESATLAQRLIRTACERHGIVAGQLTSHRDRGSIQTAKDLHALYEDLGVVRSLSRPRVSNGHPFSESQFKTTKYSPTYPERFDDFAHAEVWCATFFQHYNEEHRHSGLAFLTPATVHHGDPAAILAQRQATMDRAYQQQPGRFVHGPPRLPLPARRGLDQPRGRSDRDRPHSFVNYSLERLIFIDRFRTTGSHQSAVLRPEGIPKAQFAARRRLPLHFYDGWQAAATYCIAEDAGTTAPTCRIARPARWTMRGTCQESPA
jgi:putative transposase